MDGIKTSGQLVPKYVVANKQGEKYSVKTVIDMLGEIMKVAAFIYYWTWFVWPFAFVFGFAHGINKLIQNKKIYNKGLIVASIALLFILAGVVYPSFQ